jgi:hypothetical protein
MVSGDILSDRPFRTAVHRFATREKRPGHCINQSSQATANRPTRRNPNGNWDGSKKVPEMERTVVLDLTTELLEKMRFGRPAVPRVTWTCRLL